MVYSVLLTPDRQQQEPYDRLKGYAAEVPAAPFQGVWTTIEVQPDLFARQRYTVGVLVANEAGQFAFRLLRDLAKFKKIYDRGVVEAIGHALALAQVDMKVAQERCVALEAMAFKSAHVSVTQAWFTSGDSMEAVLERLYREVVPMLTMAERRALDRPERSFWMRRVVNGRRYRLGDPSA